MHLSPIQIFFVFAILNTFAAIYSPILDCDEVFNFWEPTHYIDRGYGFQTWEYSPEFALRTWLYPAVHAVIAMIGRIGTIFATKTFQFYFTRFALGLICAICETRLYAQVCRTLNASIGLILALVLAVSPGMFHASVALLPSSFAMYMVMLAIASFLDWRGGPHTAQGIFWLGAGSVFAWPFLGILILPFMGEEAFIATYSPNFDEAWRDLATRILYGITRITILGGFEFFFDLSMYRKYVFFPWNLVKYNVLSAVEGKGPSIFGTEPWHWYLQNLSINFNLWFLLALLAGPLLFHQTFILRRPTSKASWIREFTVISPLYLWLAIFTVQPHKEERFMYPIYPAIVLNAAISAHILLVNIGSRSRGQGVPVISALPANLRLLLIGSIVSVAISLGGLRTVGLISAYGGPMSVYEPLHKHELANEADNVCIAKEWYRFPSSYHLPQGVRAKFVRSAFDGLLPGEFSEASSGFGLLPGAWLVPAGMNDRNIHDPGKYVRLHSDDQLIH